MSFDAARAGTDERAIHESGGWNFDRPRRKFCDLVSFSTVLLLNTEQKACDQMDAYAVGKSYWARRGRGEKRKTNYIRRYDHPGMNIFNSLPSSFLLCFFFSRWRSSLDEEIMDKSCFSSQPDPTIYRWRHLSREKSVFFFLFFSSLSSRLCPRSICKRTGTGENTCQYVSSLRPPVSRGASLGKERSNDCLTFCFVLFFSSSSISLSVGTITAQCYSLLHCLSLSSSRRSSHWR